MQILKKEMALMGKSVEQVANEIKGLTKATLWNLINGAKPRHSTTKKLIDYGFSEEAALIPAKEVKV